MGFEPLTPLLKGARKSRLVVLFGSKTHDFASLAAGAEVSTTVTVPGAKLGDFAMCSLNATGGFPAGLDVTANVTVANTVTVNLGNQTAGAIDPGSGTLACLVFQLSR